MASPSVGPRSWIVSLNVWGVSWKTRYQGPESNAIVERIPCSKKYPAARARYFDVVATGTYISSNGQAPLPCTGLVDSSAEAGSTVPRAPAVAIRRANTSGTMSLRITHPFQGMTTLYAPERLPSIARHYSAGGQHCRPVTTSCWTPGRGYGAVGLLGLPQVRKHSERCSSQ